MKIIEGWHEIRRQQAGDELRVLYEVGSYRIAVADVSYQPGGLYITVQPIDHGSYYPDIYIDSGFGREFQEIKIQTTSWGALGASEIEKVIKAYTEAQALATKIKAAFPECFGK